MNQKVRATCNLKDISFQSQAVMYSVKMVISRKTCKTERERSCKYRLLIETWKVIYCHWIPTFLMILNDLQIYSLISGLSRRYFCSCTVVIYNPYLSSCHAWRSNISVQLLRYRRWLPSPTQLLAEWSCYATFFSLSFNHRLTGNMTAQQHALS